MVPLELFVSKGKAKMRYLQWQLKSYWMVVMKDLATLVFLLEEWKMATGGDLVFRSPSPGIPPSLFTLMHWRLVGEMPFLGLALHLLQTDVHVFCSGFSLWLFSFSSQSIVAQLILAVHPGQLCLVHSVWLSVLGSLCLAFSAWPALPGLLCSTPHSG